MYWVSRYALASTVLFAILVAIEFIQGGGSTNGILGSLAWALLASAIFIGSKYLRFRKEQGGAANGRK
ncbi:hypothetical protein [Janthinobacterium sp. CG_S6]|nr:hypothetical protein [Janthinobacterium sp. CG_S6]